MKFKFADVRKGVWPERRGDREISKGVWPIRRASGLSGGEIGSSGGRRAQTAGTSA
jgi:hypothetical protein